MFCIRCGNHIADDIRFCPHCGAAAYQEPAVPMQQVYAAQNAASEAAREPVRTGLALAIVFTVLSFLFGNVLGLITGIIAIVFAAMAGSKRDAGKIEEAKCNVRVAKAMNITTIILFVLWIVMIVALIIFAVQMTMDAMQIIEQSGVADMSAQQLDEFLREYGYAYDLDVLEEYLEHGMFLQ